MIDQESIFYFYDLKVCFYPIQLQPTPNFNYHFYNGALSIFITMNSYILIIIHINRVNI